MNITAIGSSTGGPATLRQLFGGLPCLNTCILLVQHMPAFINMQVCMSLQAITGMDVRLASNGDPLAPGCVLIAPSDFHMRVIGNRSVRLEKGAPINYVCPAIDATMMSLQRRAGDELLGIILTGLGNDGAAGLRHIKSLGGVTLAQDEQTSTIYGMPKAAVETGCVDYEGSPDAIRAKLLKLFGGGVPLGGQSAVCRTAVS